jgi:hypothetical protein
MSGGLYVEDSEDILIDNTKFISNNAMEYGGGLALDTIDKMTVSNTLFKNNLGFNGGGLNVMSSNKNNDTLIFYKSFFMENNAMLQGGMYTCMHDFTNNI